ncbi:hypothetical protein PHYBLDRAFT_61621 [Phycomyces blakesleeanus NRRL 1555(-)]|uniref:Uncharacterized protein n=1 Tax=Phycomyces blakesleeanus (strain ATCC 8743b / DSM 1359 / FGSC 10004 / NBRC 33097 / NRRL 1555) TaxID=763407 RepID=A0A163EP72_PHYB8|nr:hypothetical protein PHYBLDRAFT_61621 [Phycomyces blakesleeanus NRRL 1555(-)]OAD80570.1 hypothetical protein PHYBLDRAFT_61621 [Phycomyces blakesleeanus NRRL 1555(-)]|eukprot:XP_018298610.1 hypothetical protein PHYBLDRAFT_61621 [Phycomyces blakesleeanus NRRL 1555(-)]
MLFSIQESISNLEDVYLFCIVLSRDQLNSSCLLSRVNLSKISSWKNNHLLLELGFSLIQQNVLAGAFTTLIDGKELVAHGVYYCWNTNSVENIKYKQKSEITVTRFGESFKQFGNLIPESLYMPYRSLEVNTRSSFLTSSAIALVNLYS